MEEDKRTREDIILVKTSGSLLSKETVSMNKSLQSLSHFFYIFLIFLKTVI